MRSYRQMVIAVLVLGWAGAASAATAVGRMAAVRGTVTVDRVATRSGSPVFATSVVESEHGKATVILGSSFVLHLGEYSRLEIKNYLGGGAQREAAGVELKEGSVRALVRKADESRKRFTLRAKAAVMGVRGTEVFVSFAGSGQPFFLTVTGLADLKLDGARSGEQPLLLGARQAFRDGERVNLTEIDVRTLIRAVGRPRAEVVSGDDLEDTDGEDDEEEGFMDEFEDFFGLDLDPLLEGDEPNVTVVPGSRKL